MNTERLKQMISLSRSGVGVAMTIGLALGFFFEIGFLLMGPGMTWVPIALIAAFGTMILIVFGKTYELSINVLESIFLATFVVGIGLAHGAFPLIRLYLFRNS